MKLSARKVPVVVVVEFLQGVGTFLKFLWDWTIGSFCRTLLDIQISNREPWRVAMKVYSLQQFSAIARVSDIYPIPFDVLSILSFLSICGNSNSTSSNRETRSKWLRNVSRALLPLSLFLFSVILSLYVQLKLYRENVNTMHGSAVMKMDAIPKWELPSIS